MWRTMWDGMDRRACRCMSLRLMAGRKATSTGRRSDRDMRERVRRECAGTKLLRRAGRADMKELVECRECLLRITAAAVAAVLNHPAERLRRAPLPGGMQARGAAG